MKINAALKKLNSLLPLEKRQKSLPKEHRKLHQKILNNFANKGIAPTTRDMGMLEKLAENDLVVLKGENIVGAYPFSLQETSHHISNDSINLYAMCAFDAVAVAPIFNIKTNIISSCHVTKEKIEIKQNASQVVKANPSSNIYIGIRWQSAGSCAADNLCMEMVFLKDKNIALQWKDNDDNYSIFILEDAIDFSTKYFKPLLGNE